jgi:ankyrin repeat protein
MGIPAGSSQRSDDLPKSKEGGVSAEDLEEALLCARYGELDELQSVPNWKTVVQCRCPHAGNTCLMLAAANNHKDMIQLLLGVVRVNERNTSGNSALHWAALNGHLEVAEMLLQAGADANVRNSFEKRPFDEALVRGFGPVCELLARATEFENDPEFAPLTNVDMSE